jgi:hypothetical protein
LWRRFAGKKREVRAKITPFFRYTSLATLGRGTAHFLSVPKNRNIQYAEVFAAPSR